MSFEISEAVEVTINSVIELFGRLISGYNSKRGEVLDEQITPLYEKMKLIHTDYYKGFKQAKNHIENEIYPDQELGKFLEGRRLHYLVERESADNLSKCLADIDKLLISPKEKELIKNLCTACMKYLKRSTAIGQLSWYSEVIAINNSLSKLDPSIHNRKAWHHPENGANVKGYLLDHINSLLNGELHMGFEPVHDTYNQLHAKLR